MSRWVMLVFALMLIFFTQAAAWACGHWLFAGAEMDDCAHRSLLAAASVTLTMERGPMDVPLGTLPAVLGLFLLAAASLPRAFFPQSYILTPLLPPPRPVFHSL